MSDTIPAAVIEAVAAGAFEAWHAFEALGGQNWKWADCRPEAREFWLDIARQSLRAASAMGWELKHRDATPDMQNAGESAGDDYSGLGGYYSNVWAAMFDAAPKVE